MESEYVLFVTTTNIYVTQYYVYWRFVHTNTSICATKDDDMHNLYDHARFQILTEGESCSSYLINNKIHRLHHPAILYFNMRLNLLVAHYYIDGKRNS